MVEFKKTHWVIAAMWMASGLAGFVDHYFRSRSGAGLLVLVGPLVLDLALVFWWLSLDNQHFPFKRSALFNVGIAALTVLFVPIYLIRSRPSEKRRASLLLYAATLVVICTAYFVGSVIGKQGAV